MSKILTLATATDGTVSIASQAEATVVDGIIQAIPGVSQFTDKVVTGMYGTVGQAVVSAALVLGTSKFVSDEWIPSRSSAE